MDESSQRGGDLLAISFGATVAIWIVAYIGLSPAIAVPPWLVAAIALAALLASGFIIGRWTVRGIRGGAAVGLMLGLINFLIVASLQNRETTGEALLAGAAWILGLTVVSIVCATAGAWIGSRSRPAIPPQVAWSSWFAGIVAFTTLPLIISGGIVTGLEAGLAVPDWLTTFGYPMMFYPMARMQEDPGVYAEHFHRLWGMLVGLSVIALVVQLFRVDHRRWVKWLSVGVLIAVIVQGLLGGPGRVLRQEVWYAIAHGVFGQIVFATLVALAAFTSVTWLSRREPTRLPNASTDHTWSVVLIVMLIVQLALGAVYRHFRREAGDPMTGIHAMYTHIALALIITVVAVLVGGRAWGHHREQPVLPRLGGALLILIGLQLVLGLVALIAALARGTAETIPVWEVASTTVHQAVGAVILATAALLAVWSRRLLRPDPTHR